LTLGEKRLETEDKDKQFSERFSGRFERRRAIRLPPEPPVEGGSRGLRPR